ncbi:MAG: DUF427 domain-containing protein [Geitlerinemataceae cyanobacterium]
MFRPTPIPPEPGQESVWDYPRPACWQATDKRIKIVFNDVVIADTRNAKRVLETSHPPSYYLPPEDINFDYLKVMPRQTFCEWKGIASYLTVAVGDRTAENAAWQYVNPTPNFAEIEDHCAFYAQMMDACTVDGQGKRI